MECGYRIIYDYRDWFVLPEYSWIIENKDNTHITDHTGTITQTLDYLPYGETRIDTGTNNEDSQYTGYKKDSTTGLNYASARYYNPERGAFISQDAASLFLGDAGNPADDLRRYFIRR